MIADVFRKHVFLEMIMDSDFLVNMGFWLDAGTSGEFGVVGSKVFAVCLIVHRPWWSRNSVLPPCSYTQSLSQGVDSVPRSAQRPFHREGISGQYFQD